MVAVGIQALGLIAWLCAVWSYWRKTKKGMLAVQIVADLFYVLHYFLLGAYTGFATIVVCLFREIGFYLCKNKAEEKRFFYLLIPIYLVVGALFSDRAIEMLPVVACIIYGYTETAAVKWMVVGGMIDTSYWLLYDAFCGSYVGIVTDVITLTSSILSLLFRRKREKG